VEHVVDVERKSLKPARVWTLMLTSVRPRGRGAPGAGRGKRAPATSGDLDGELDSFMKNDAVSAALDIPESRCM
jgi:hypothetical protein